MNESAIELIVNSWQSVCNEVGITDDEMDYLKNSLDISTINNIVSKDVRSNVIERIQHYRKIKYLKHLENSN